MSIDKKNLLTRRNFLKGAVGISLLAAGAYFLPGTSLFRRAQNSARMLSGDLHARYVRQIITSTPADSRRIMWEADASLTDAAVEYRQPGSEDIRTAKAVDETFTDDGYTSNQYGATISGLQADTDYEYRIISTDAKSEWHKLHTASRVRQLQAADLPRLPVQRLQ